MASNGTWKWVAVIVSVFGAVYLLTRKGAAGLVALGKVGFSTAPGNTVEGSSVDATVTVTNTSTKAGAPFAYIFKTRLTVLGPSGELIYDSTLGALDMTASAIFTGTPGIGSGASWTFTVPVGKTGTFTAQVVLYKTDGASILAQTTVASFVVTAAIVNPAGTVRWAQ